MTSVAHPLALVTQEEIAAAAALVRADPRFPEGAVFAHLRLREPHKDAVLGYTSGTPFDRQIEAIVVPPGQLVAYEVVVSVTAGAIREWTAHDDMRPALMFGESIQAITALRADPAWQAAMRKRGIEDFDLVQIDPWPAGSFDSPHEEGRRISRCISHLRESNTDNGYARPIEGVLAFVDGGRHEVLEVLDLGVVPLPPERAAYLADEVGPHRDGLKPLDIVQAEGPSFTVDGNVVQWQQWSFRVGWDPYEGLVLHQVTYHDGDRARPVLHRASVTEMVVPYGDTSVMHNWKN